MRRLTCSVPQIFQIIYSAFISTGTYYGLGKKMAEIADPADFGTAVMYMIFSQVAGILFVGVGKLAVGAFLLRLVRDKIQIAVIRIFIALTILLTLFASIVVVIQCLPPEKIWNRTVPGYCWLDFTPVGFAVGCECCTMLPKFDQ